MELTGKCAIVTGASRGIGRACAVSLAKAGASVVINYSQNKGAAEEVKKTIEECGASAAIVRANVSQYNECEKIVKCAIDHFKRIDILINNAGITRDNLLARMKAEEWQEVIDVNLNGVYNCCKAVLRPLLKQKSGGRIINIASVAGIHGNSGQANYAAAKGGVIAFTRTMAKELGSRNITVNAVAPGFIETEMTDELSDAVKEKIKDQIALKRFGKPEDVAEVVTFLASSAAYVTGQVIAVDGNLSM